MLIDLDFLEAWSTISILLPLAVLTDSISLQVVRRYGILARLFYLQIIFSNSYYLITLKVSCLSTLNSIYKNSLYFPCVIYLQSFNTGLIYTISTCKTWKKDSIYVATGEIYRAIFCLTWYRLHIFIYNIVSSPSLGHQNHCNNNFPVTKASILLYCNKPLIAVTTHLQLSLIENYHSK